MTYSVILVDDPAPMVRRITLNRPEKRNALNTPLRREIILALREADADPDVRVSIIRGAGKCFSAGYDLAGDPPDAGAPADWFTSGEGQFQRQVTGYWTSIWDLAKPVIAQVHSYCLAGGSELATGCDVVYVVRGRQDRLPRGALRHARPAVPRVDVRDAQRHGDDAHRRPAERRRGGRVRVRQRACSRPTSSRSARSRWRRASRRSRATSRRSTSAPCTRRWRSWAFRDSIKAGIPLCTQATRTETFQAFMADRTEGLTSALQKRDAKFGDYRTAEERNAK